MLRADRRSPAASTVHPPKDDDGLAGRRSRRSQPTNGSIYQVGRDVALFENPIARHVGDIVTIVLNEQTAAKKSATTTTTKNTNDTLPGMTLLGAAATIHGTPVLSNNINDATKFAGEGDSAQSNSLTGYITATVMQGSAQWQPVREGREVDRHQPGRGIRAPDRRRAPDRSRAGQLHSVAEGGRARRSPMAARARSPMPTPRAGCRASSTHPGHRSDATPSSCAACPARRQRC